MRRTFLIFLFLYLGKLVCNGLAYGKVEIYVAKNGFEQAKQVAANLQKPVGYENSPGSNQYLGVGGLDTIIVPNVVGRVADPIAMERFLKGSGFHIKVIRYEVSQTIPEGMIISQIPCSLTEVKSRGLISVVVSTGKDTECADILNIDEKLRGIYQKPGTDTRIICANIRKLKNGASN